jgi:hypothetical protein
MENVKTASGSALNNDLIDKVLSATVQTETPEISITSPSDTLVNLPAGFITPDGEVTRVAEVRELNGKDEEVLGKSAGGAKSYSVVLSRAVVSIGGIPTTDAMLDSLLLGDRDALMLGIYKATFGSTVELYGLCTDCGNFNTVEMNIDRDVVTKILVDPIADRRFTVQGRAKEFLVALPTGAVQKDLAAANDKTSGERNTILLQNTVLEIDGRPVMGKAQIQALGVMDRNTIASEIGKRLPGPQFEDIKLPCPDCEGTVVVPFNLGTLFQL